MLNTDQEKDLARVKAAIGTLREFFDTVQIFTTRIDDSGHNTMSCHYGAGNWYARYGHIKAWVHDEERDYIGRSGQQETKKEEWE